MKSFFQNANDEDCKAMQENFEKLIAEKERLFPEENRRIFGCEIQVKGGQEHITVLFATEKNDLDEWSTSRSYKKGNK